MFTPIATAGEAPAQATREQMIEAHMPLVRYVVNRMSASGPSGLMETEDAVGYGTEGLIQAVDKYDPSRGAAFATFAMQRIRGAILDAARQMDILPRPMRHDLRELEVANLELANMLGRWPTVKELALKTGLTVKRVQDIQGLHGTRVRSLDQPFDSDADLEWDVADEDESIDPQAVTDRRAMRSLLGETLRGLPPRDRELLHLRYNRRMTLHAIAHRLGISESRASQIHSRVVRSLRSNLQNAVA